MIYEQIIRIAIGEKGEPLLKVIDSCNEVCLKVISTVMYFTPIGVFCTIVPVVEANGTSTIVSLATQLIILYVAFYGFAFIVYGGAVKFLGKTSPFKFFRAIMPAALNAFGTCSSSATIPISKSCVENELGVSNQISSIAIASFAALATMAGLPAGVMGVYISINTLCDMGATCVNVIGDMAGCVYVNGQKEDKAGSMFDCAAEIEVRGNTLRYVSRGGLKLEKAMKNFGVELEGKVCMDVGASTGGFTDCMLQNGAVKVYSVDVGHGQLDWKLRNDERVVCMEKTNIRYVTPEDIEEPVDFSSIDVSFISLTKVLLPVRNLLSQDGQIVCLIKPQFEAGREKVGKKGVVRDPAVHKEVIEKVIAFAKEQYLQPLALDFSPIKGPEGNIEYLLYLQKKPEGSEMTDGDMDVDAVVGQAHGTLDK